MKKLVLYHAHCNDGFGAAWVARKALGNAAEYRPVQYGDPVPRDVDGRELLLLDFAWSREVLLDLDRRSRSLLVLDHHITAKQDLEGLAFAEFDLELSGATLAWRHFFGDETCPWLLKYIEDRDLWRWELPESEEVAAALQSYRRGFDVWDKIMQRGKDALVAEGRPVLRYKRRLVKAASSRVRMIELAGYEVPCVTSCILQSEIGGLLSKKHPFVTIVFEMEDRRVWSLRSDSKTGVNVGDIARARGGGGHPNAASYIEPLDAGAGPLGS